MKKPKKKPPKPLVRWAMFTGYGFQLGLTLYLAARLGKWLDEMYTEGDNTYTLLCVLIGLFLSIYVLIKQINRMNL